MDFSFRAFFVSLLLVILVAVVSYILPASSSTSPYQMGGSYDQFSSGVPIAGNRAIFAIVWPILYIFLVVIGYTVFKQEKDYLLQGLYIAILVLNIMWVYYFFYSGSVQGGLFTLYLSIIVIGYFLYQFKKRIPECDPCQKRLKYWSLFLAIVYFVWIVLAAYLNSTIADKICQFSQMSNFDYDLRY